MLPVPAPAFYEYQRTTGMGRESYTVIGIETDDGDGTFLERSRLICLTHQGRLTWLGASQLTFDVDYLPPAPNHGADPVPEDGR